MQMTPYQNKKLNVLMFFADGAFSGMLARDERFPTDVFRELAIEDMLSK